MSRISRQQMFMGIAHLVSQRSTCFRLNVGAVVVRDNNIIGMGYNGQEPGAPHCAGNDCPGIVPGRCGTLHAEVNALTKAGIIELGKVRKPLDLYCTDSPCGFCVEFILEHTSINVHKIFYEKAYRDVTPLQQLHGKVEVFNVTPAGYIVEHFTRKVVELP